MHYKAARARLRPGNPENINEAIERLTTAPRSVPGPLPFDESAKHEDVLSPETPKRTKTIVMNTLTQTIVSKMRVPLDPLRNVLP